MQLNTPSTPIVAIERRISIHAPLKQVFDFVSDLRNDASWRQEINATELDTFRPGIGTIAVEDAYLSAKHPHSLNRLAYVAYEPDSYMRCATVADHPTWMEVERTFKQLGPTLTEFTYALRFERKVVQQALGFAPPLWFLRWYSGYMMGKYQRKLKHLLEHMPAAVAQPTSKQPA
jgi:hypothetical protein